MLRIMTQLLWIVVFVILILDDISENVTSQLTNNTDIKNNTKSDNETPKQDDFRQYWHFFVWVLVGFTECILLLCALALCFNAEWREFVHNYFRSLLHRLTHCQRPRLHRRRPAEPVVMNNVNGEPEIAVIDIH